MVEEQLAHRGIRSQRVLDVMSRVPRERFVPAGMVGRAYEDSALPVDCGQTISQPYMVARMTELLDPQPDQRILEIGTGTAYQTAVLAHLAGEVYTIEWHLRLMTQAAERLAELGLGEKVFLRCGDGSVGWPEKAPFDAILVTAGAPDVPPALVDQLAAGGRLVIPVGPADNQMLMLLRRTERGVQQEEVLPCRFVKLLGAAGWEL